MNVSASLPLRLDHSPSERRLAWRRRAIVLLMGIAVVVLGVLSIGVGSIEISPLRVVLALVGQGSRADELIILNFRLPRIVLSICVGAALAVSGTVLQALTRNPLAAPEVVGINGGAGLGAIVMISWAPAVLAGWLVPGGAFAGAAITGAIVYFLSRRQGVVSPGRLALIGVATSGLALAGIQLVLVMTVFTGDIQIALQWLVGSLWAASWDNVWGLLPITAVLLPLAWLMAEQLDLFGLGDDVPRTLGARLEALKLIALAMAVILAASAVSVAGTITFVGLLAPHICRRLVGPCHRILVPATAVGGALLVLAADTVGRILIAPFELPVGLCVAVLGAPYFLLQLRRRGLGRP